MTDGKGVPPEKLYISNAISKTKDRMKNATTYKLYDNDIEYVLKNSFIEMHKFHCEEMSAIRQEATKYVRGFWETHHQAIKDFSHVKDSPQYKPMFDLIFQDLIQAIKQDLGCE